MLVVPKKLTNGLRTDYLFNMKLPKTTQKVPEIIVKFRTPSEIQLPEKLTCLGGRETTLLACNVEDKNLVSVNLGKSGNPYSFTL